MNLVKTSFLNGLAVIIKVATALVLNKVLAIYVGPTGYAVIGQFQSLLVMVSTFASGGVNTGVTKYTAEFHEDPQQQEDVLRTAASISLMCACVFVGLLVIFRKPLAAWTLADMQLSGVIVWLAAALIPMLFNGLLLATLNGRKAITAYVIANIAGSLVTALTAMALVLKFGLYGVLVAMAISQALACIVTFWLFQRTGRIRWRNFLGPINRNIARRLGGFALIGATSALAVPVAQMLIRDGLVDRLGWQSAGLWQALSKISEMHLMLLTTTLSLYFLPRFSEIKDATALRKEVVKGYRFVLPLIVASAALIFFLRELLIRLLLTDKFLPLADVLGWQMVGDVLKISSWVMAYTMISHARIHVFIITELAFSLLWVILTLGGASMDGLRGAILGYVLTYAIYGVVMYFLFINLLKSIDLEKTKSSINEFR